MAVAVVLGGLCLFSSPASGANPPGSIYYTQGSPPGSFYMNAGGTGNTPTQPGEPSYFTHAGSRWFLQRNGLYLLAVSEAAPANPVILWTFTWDGDNINSPGRVRWTKNDFFVSFMAYSNRTYDASGNTVMTSTSTVYTIPIDWSSGSPSPGLVATPIVAEGYVAGLQHYKEAEGIMEHDWSPDGSKLVYQAGGYKGGGFVPTIKVKVGGAAPVALASGQEPVWCPSTVNSVDRIALTWFDQFGRAGIAAINVSGSGYLQLTKGNATVEDSGPIWSPDGNYLAFTRRTMHGGGSNWWTEYDVFRIPTAGGKAVNLTANQPSTSYGTVAWR